MTTSEVLYSIRVSPLGGLVEIAKWEGAKGPTDTYSVTARGKGHCNCFGSMGNRWCKHKEMLKIIALKGYTFEELCGAFYDFDRGILYTPEDGEGVPTKGAVNIIGEARIQGKVYP